MRISANTWRNARAKTFFHASVSVLASLCMVIAPIVGSHGMTSVGATLTQAQVITVGVLTFQDESGAGAPQELGQKIAQSLQQKINVNKQNLLARSLSLATDESSVKAM